MDTTQDYPATAYRALALWGIGHDTTSCAKTIAWILIGRPETSTPFSRMYPTDAEDMGCCLRLVLTIPGFHEHLDSLRFLSPVWNAIVDAWPWLEKAYEEDLVTKQHYDRQHAALTEANFESEESERALEEFDFGPEPKRALHRCLLVILEAHAGPDYKGRVAAYDAATGHTYDDLFSELEFQERVDESDPYDEDSDEHLIPALEQNGSNT